MSSSLEMWLSYSGWMTRTDNGAVDSQGNIFVLGGLWRGRLVGMLPFPHSTEPGMTHCAWHDHTLIRISTAAGTGGQLEQCWLCHPRMKSLASHTPILMSLPGLVDLEFSQDQKDSLTHWTRGRWTADQPSLVCRQNACCCARMGNAGRVEMELEKTTRGGGGLSAAHLAAPQTHFLTSLTGLMQACGSPV